LQEKLREMRKSRADSQPTPTLGIQTELGLAPVGDWC